MFKKKILGVMLIFFTFSLTGCNNARAKEVASDTDAQKEEVINDMNQLKEDTFYVYDGKEYKPVYMKRASFDDESEINLTQSDDRTLYFNDDWDKVPTLYAGDSLIYYTSKNLDENFIIERFEDFEYSIGLSNLSRLDSGRYSFLADKESDAYDKNPYINPSSDANKLFELAQEQEDQEETQVIIDNIGGAHLRSGNISRGGVIIGLEKDKYYSTDVYCGSKLKNYLLKADTRMLTSMEVYTVTNYSFLRSKVLKLNLPKYFNSGYYMVNGQGIFRYVKGKTYTEKTDFNIANKVPEDEEEQTKEKKKEINESKNTIKEEFTINAKCNVIVNFTCGEAKEDYEMDAPTVKVIGNECSYTLSENDENTQILEAELDAGKYILEITGLNGRTYDYEIVKGN